MPRSSDGPYEPLEEPDPRAPPPEAAVVVGKRTCKDRYHSPLAFTLVVSLSLIIASAPAGYGSGVTSTILKRFQISSTMRGAQPTFYDVVSLFTTIFVTHFGHSRHRPRVIGVIQMLSAVGLLITTVPHFLYPPPDFIIDPHVPANTTTDDYMCHATSSGGGSLESEGGSLLNQYAWMFVAACFTSFGSSVIPLTIPYIDDCVDKQKTSIYAGVIIGSYSLGSVLGYMLASICLSVPAYPSLAHLPNYPHSPAAPNWIGAWWLGYLVLGILLLLTSPMFFCFPKRMPLQGSKKAAAEDAARLQEAGQDQGDDNAVQEVQDSAGLKTGIYVYLSTLIKSILRILYNLPVLCLFGAGLLHLATTAGVQVFSASYIQFEFGLPASSSSLILGIIIIPSAFTGTMVGGYIVKRWGKTRVKIAWIYVIFSVFSFLFDPMSLFLGCPTGDIAGVTEPYNYTGAPPPQPFPEVNSTCNADCHCELELYKPVCGEDGLTYITPCYAGCTTNITRADNKTEYQGCSCIPGGATATSGACQHFCVDQFRLYTAYGFLMAMSITLVSIPGLMLLLRCVTEEDRSLAITVGNVISKIFGQIPAPLVFGAIIDGCCILYQMVSGKQGSCLVYNSDALRFSFNGLVMSLHFVAMILVIFAALVISIQDRDQKQELEESDAYRPLTNVDDDEDDYEADVAGNPRQLKI